MAVADGGCQDSRRVVDGRGTRQGIRWRGFALRSGLLVFWLSLFLLAGACWPGGGQAAIQCYECHGTSVPVDYRPLDAPSRTLTTGGFQGNHRTHLPPGAGPAACATCHPGSTEFSMSHRTGNIILSNRINNSPLITPYNGKLTPFKQTATPQLGSCANVNCHFETLTPVWGGSRLAMPGNCSTCHGAPPSDGAHLRKHNEYYGTGLDSCGRCHIDHSVATAPFAHATSAGKRPLIVRFTAAPNTGGSYNGTVSYPVYLPSQSPVRNGTCTNLYCHSDGRGGTPVQIKRWSDPTPSKCYSCHRGRTIDNTQAICTELGGAWDAGKQVCVPYVNMTTNGHSRLVGPQWIRRYPCYYCHAATVDAGGAILDRTRHANGTKDVVMASQWAIVGRALPSYVAATKTCDNVYCHSDGTTDPEQVRPFAWTASKTDCNSCHGHPRGSCSNSGCHDGRTDTSGKVWTIKTTWASGQEWKAALPMFANQGPGTARANSHARHTETNFTCDECHAATIINGTCTDCHKAGIPPGSMGEVAHLNGTYHVNKTKDVVFKRGGSYSIVAKTCTNTVCHTGGTDPQWGGSVTSAVICLTCHGTAAADIDNFGFSNFSTQAKINLTEWVTSGHGRPTSAGPYPSSGNPAANFPANPCWYCHDNTVLHNDLSNPFRLRRHSQFESRFNAECVYCHMSGVDSECLGCHNSTESLAPQLSSMLVMTKHGGTLYSAGCRVAACHDTDARTHNSGAGFWTETQKTDVKSQYLMMGVCLKCHDDDSGGKCTSCHNSNPSKYILGFRPFSSAEYRFIKPQKARATSAHFGYKHYRAQQLNGVWKGGKFCWDCHDPHGDSNIYMIQSQVATTTDGTFGIPRTRAAVSFTRKQSGLDYVRLSSPYIGICNVCHASLNEAKSKHYGKDYSDSHNASRVCTTCHEHRFTDSHADDQPCNSCHLNKPVPRHSGFGQPRDCTKCHGGTIGLRMDVMGQMRANSHHVQGTTATNRHCYACHWEATSDGLIDVRYHEGYNYKTYTSVKNAKVDLVLWGPGVRPPLYKLYTTAVQFVAARIGTANERGEAAKVSNHCISCHSDQNNDTQPFGDCKTPRQYAWDRQSVAARYSQTGTTKWGKYNSATFTEANQKDQVTKAFSAHGNVAANQGGWSQANGVDSAIPNQRAGSQNVLCYDCHSSHGSKVTGTTSSYVTFNGTRNGGNLKETQAGKGGYSMSYQASANPDTGSVNPYSAGAGQCFDCHLTQNAGTTPWGYQSTFGVTDPIRGYFDSPRFGGTTPGYMLRYPYKTLPIKGGHLKASAFLNHTTAGQNKIMGLCTPCHDPHGVSPTLGAKQAYSVPLLKGTWMTSPYREDVAPADTTTPPGGQPISGPPSVYTDQTTFGGQRITENEDRFAGLCLRCHAKKNLTNGTEHTWKSQDRVHESVKGWKTANGTIQHSYTCSKCHTPHTSGLPRLMQTDCLNYNHRGRIASGGQAGSGSYPLFEYRNDPGPDSSGSFPRGVDQSGVNCHPTGIWPDNSWNRVTPW